MKGKADSNRNEGEEFLSIYPVGTLRHLFSHILIILTADQNNQNISSLVPCL